MQISFCFQKCTLKMNNFISTGLLKYNLQSLFDWCKLQEEIGLDSSWDHKQVSSPFYTFAKKNKKNRLYNLY